MTRRTLAVGWLAVLIAAIGWLLPATAHAHSSQISSSPAEGAELTSPPREVTVTFDAPLLDVGAAMVLRVGDRTVSRGAPQVRGRSVTVAVDPAAPDGAYSVAYRVVSKDGHTVESSFTFRVGAASGVGTPSVAPSVAPSIAPSLPPTVAPSLPPTVSEHSTLVWIVAGVLLLVIAGVGTAVLRR